MAFVQDWPAPTSATIGSTVTATGTATTPGNDLFASLIVRDPTVDTVTITDDGSNTWVEVAHVVNASAYLGLFRAAGAAAASSVTASWVDDAEQSVSAASSLLVMERSGVGAEIDTSTDMLNPDGGTPGAITATGAGQLLVATGGSQVSNRTWAITDTGVTATPGVLFQGGQTSNLTGHGYTDGAGDVAIGWTRTAGSGADLAIINALYDVGSAGPDPLSVSVGADRSIWTGQTLDVEAVVTGGPGDPTYTWAVVSGPSGGTFADPNEAATVFTPNGVGVYILRCTVSDPPDSGYDDLTLTVSGVPEGVVTVAAVNAAVGWSAVGGSPQEVLSDTSDDTWMESPDTPVGEVLDVTLEEITLLEGQDLIVYVTARHTGLASGTFDASLYVESTLVETVAGITFGDSYEPIPVRFSAANLDAGAEEYRLVTEWTGTPL